MILNLVNIVSQKMSGIDKVPNYEARQNTEKKTIEKKGRKSVKLDIYQPLENVRTIAPIQKLYTSTFSEPDKHRLKHIIINR